jgi:FtsZ-binding cell division protein ZapB
VAQPEVKPGEGTPEDKPKVELTQERVQELINEAFGKGATKVEKEKLGPMEAKLTEALSTISTLQGEIEGLKKKGDPKPGEKPGDKDDEKDKDAADKDRRTREGRLQAQLDELQENFKKVLSERDTLKSERETIAKREQRTQFEKSFFEVADEFKFFKNSTVLRELEDVLRREDNGDFVVINPKTNMPRLNSEMKPFSLKDLLSEYAASNPHMVKTEVDGGSGGSETRKVGNTGGKKAISELTDAEVRAIEQRLAAGERIPASEFAS